MARHKESLVPRYLERYATKQWAVARRVQGTFEHVLVVPALNERVGLLDGYRQAARAAPGPVLVILVVNAHDGVPAEWLLGNQRLLAQLVALGPAAHLAEGAVQIADPDFSVLALDRSSAGLRVPREQGVGLARRIGADIALGLWWLGRLGSPWIATTDADARLPPEFFHTLAHAPGDAALLAHPYVHGRSSDPRLDAAYAAYELWLRHHVLGLRWARSPYALHTIGSTLSVAAGAYAAVRGFPKRAAGEDFHLVAKLLKVGRAHCPRTPPIVLEARASARVPFGTGPGVERAARELDSPEGFSLLAPEAFTALRRVLEALDEVAASGSPRAFERVLGDSSLPQACREVLQTGGLPSEIQQVGRRAHGAEARRRRLHDRFDALASLRLLHAARDGGLGTLPWREALARAPFTPRAVDFSTALELRAALDAMRSLDAPSLAP